MIRISKALLVALVLSCAVHAQSQKVVQLSSADATEAKRLYDAMKDADAKWAAFRKKIGATYAKGASFEFDETFRFVVPGWGDIYISGSSSGRLLYGESTLVPYLTPGYGTVTPCPTKPE